MSGKRKCDMDGFCADCGLPLMKEDYRFCRRCEHRGMPVANPGNHRLKMIHNPPSWKQKMVATENGYKEMKEASDDC